MKSTTKTAFIVKMQADKRSLLEKQIIELGYFYIRDGVKLARVGKYLEDVVDGKIQQSKKIFDLGIDKDE